MTALMEIENWTSCMCSAYAVPMPQDTSDSDAQMSNRAFRVPDDLWESYGKAVKALRTTRSDDLRRHMAATVAAYEREQRRIARESRTADES